MKWFGRRSVPPLDEAAIRRAALAADMETALTERRAGRAERLAKAEQRRLDREHKSFLTDRLLGG